MALPPLRETDPRSILVVLPTWVGDFVMATPALRAIRTRFPAACITFLMEPNLREVVRGGDWMNECVEWPAKARRRPWHREYRQLVAGLRSRQFDWAVLFPNAARAALIAWFAGAQRRIGYDRDGRGLLLTDRIDVVNRRRRGMAARRAVIPDRSGGRYLPMPIVEYYADLVEAIGCERPGDRLELFTTPDAEAAMNARLESHEIAEHHPLVVLSPGAKFGASKCWMPERYAQTADRLITECGAAVVITCGPGEERIARAIGAAMRQQAHVFDAAPLPTLGEIKSLVARSDLLLCNDAGLRHFARAFAVPVVTVFGPTHPEWTATSYAAERIVRIDVDCGPCQQKVCPLGHHQCMTGVSVDMVFSAAAEMLELRARAATCAR